MRLCRACDTDRESGVALVEFALVAPVLLLLLLSFVEFGKAFNYWIDETQLASAGARWAVVNKLVPGSPALRCDKSTPVKTPASLQEFIQCQADSSELRNGGTTSLPNKVRVCIDSGSSTISFANLKIGDPIKVTVTATYHWVPLIGDAIGIASSTISGSSTMRLEAVPTNLSQGCYPT